ncbi:hypothetical protein PGT21_019142 [Puccinia graminis f. sp. tritici]|uniref:CCHC-type domain-containing protein n=1 Tax=Puccinia graminis f. sp. tritici TaxID=56615 RepID=A0A5B0N8N8_PUCGR|nr:hypothetical protein PGTUg99_000701 [Puccinia graminis f. sp. tritici]KAA1084149.1 hypothetical protein PGT21_019142 [Puccinia graminis f. sp. tritici]KAA1084863.1 hypothetical protein PGTUg99_002656 [Puccinia graminis f. sp. tritici]KAA1093383.1 hypothetical protein PGTUg99_027729 [Puccinia graminis f. sp. tritici]KAA1109862.1 hypothetical protein PGTUg99_035975 [Puccinia graminis f. sp. tritici]
MAVTDLTSVKLAPANQQICDRLLRGLDNSWKTIHDHLVYLPQEVSLDNAISALESHEVSTSAPLDHVTQEHMASVAAAKNKQQLGFWNCGQKGHHSEICPNPSIKSKSKPTSKSGDVCAGAVSTVQLGHYPSGIDKARCGLACKMGAGVRLSMPLPF